MSLGFRSTIASSFHENSSECPARWSDAALSAQRGSLHRVGPEPSQQTLLTPGLCWACTQRLVNISLNSV